MCMLIVCMYVYMYVSQFVLLFSLRSTPATFLCWRHTIYQLQGAFKRIAATLAPVCVTAALLIHTNTHVCIYECMFVCKYVACLLLTNFTVTKRLKVAQIMCKCAHPPTRTHAHMHTRAHAHMHAKRQQSCNESGILHSCAGGVAIHFIACHRIDYNAWRK